MANTESTAFAEPLATPQSARSPVSVGVKRRLLCAPALMFALCGASSAAAQESGAVGVTMGYPAAVGLMWHVSDRFALRPEVSLSTSKSDSPGVSTLGASTSSSTTTGVGISGLFYVGKWDALRTYVAPRFVYSRLSGTSKSTSESLSFGPTGVVTTTIATTTETRNTGKSAMGLFGAAYSLHTRFSVFGEIGFGYSSSSSTSASTPARSFDISNGSTSNSWGTRTGVGVIFYF